MGRTAVSEEANTLDSFRKGARYAPNVATRPEKTGFAKVLTEARKAAGFKDAYELADASGVSRARIAQIESGDYEDLKLSTIEALAKAVKKDPLAMLAESREPIARPELEALLLRFRSSYWNTEYLRTHSREGIASDAEIEEIRKDPPEVLLGGGANEEAVAKVIEADRATRRR
jgi:transcriptional regulator with XRE-family HTH domain